MSRGFIGTSVIFFQITDRRLIFQSIIFQISFVIKIFPSMSSERVNSQGETEKGKL